MSYDREIIRKFDESIFNQMFFNCSEKLSKDNDCYDPTYTASRINCDLDKRIKERIYSSIE